MKNKQKQRNGHAFHPIMRKGGAHEQSKSGQRQAEKNQTRKQAREWRDHSSSPLPIAA